MRLTACINVYHDAAKLRACLASLAGVADRVVVVDGRYADFPSYGADDQGASQDDTLAVARAAGATIVEAPCGKPWADEIVKRNAYMDACEAGDYLLVVDADERAEGTVDREALAARSDWMVGHYRIEQYELNRARKHGEEEAKTLGSLWLHRLFAWREGIRYEGAHNIVHVGSTVINPLALANEPAARFAGLRLRHEQVDDWPRACRKDRYYQRLALAEKPYRERMCR